MSGIKWQPIVKAKTSVLFQWYVFEGHKERYLKNSLGIKASLLNGKIVSDEIFIDLNEWAKFEKDLASEVESNKDFLRKFVSLCYQYSDELIQTSKRVGLVEGPRELKTRELLSLYEGYQDSVLALMPFMNGTLALDNILKKKIISAFEIDLGIRDQKEQDLLLSKLIIPKEKSYFVQETEALLGIALKLKKDKEADIEQVVRDYLEKFAWMSSIAYLGKFRTEDEAMEKVNNLIKENPEERLKEVKQIKKDTQNSYWEAFERIKKFPQLVELIDLGREFIYLQTYRLDVFFLAHFHACPLLEAIAQKFGLLVDELVYLTGDEIVDLLRERLKVNKKEIRNRMSDYALIEEGGKYTLLSGKQVKKVVRKATTERTVKGTVANRGRATGKARLVYEVEDMSKVNKGDIIISPMTHPKLAPAIIKASGIITDFGGMLCHAAIVSREFGIPCLVGTKKSTRSFKDNDLIELNAYEGVARKIGT